MVEQSKKQQIYLQAYIGSTYEAERRTHNKYEEKGGYIGEYGTIIYDTCIMLFFYTCMQMYLWLTNKCSQHPVRIQLEA